MATHKRILSVLLCALLVASTTACGNSVSLETTVDETTADTAEAVEVAEVAESSAEENVSLPDKTFDDEEVMFLTAHCTGYDWYSSYEIYSAEINGELINDAVFNRNKTIEDRLKIQISQTKLENPHNVAKESLNAGDTQFDVVMPYINDTISLATQGVLMDLQTVPWLDLEQSWWDQRANANMRIADKLFITTGDITILDNECTMVMFFNKYMIKQYSLESPYDLVKANKWTLDKVDEMASVVTNDTDGNGVLDHSDTWGLSIAGNAPISFYFGAGERIVDTDETGNLALQIGSASCGQSYDALL